MSGQVKPQFVTFEISQVERRLFAEVAVSQRLSFLNAIKYAALQGVIDFCPELASQAVTEQRRLPRDC